MSVDYRPEYDPADVDSDYGHTGGDITVPTFTANMKPFRFWCQKALPLVYDDSLSYYEVLCKVVKQMNDFLTDLQTATGAIDQFAQQFVINQQFLNDMADQLGQNVQDLEDYINDRLEDYMTAYTQLQNYVNNYFDNLDVQQEINNKLDEMAEDGTFNTLFDPVITAWMTAKTAQIDAAIANQDAIQAQQNGRISVLEGRMDTFSGLPSGSTSGNAELLDIRTNFLGEKYPTAGDAVRASDMIASGFQSIGFSRLTEWDGNKSDSRFDTIQIDVRAYKGGHMVVIANTYQFVIDIEDGAGIELFGTNVAGKTVDSNAHQYPFPDGVSGIPSPVFKDFTVLTTSVQDEERILIQLAIPEDFQYQYLKLGNVAPIPGEGYSYTQPAAIVYANSWSKTQVDPTLTIAGDAADAKAAGDAIDELNDDLNELLIPLELVATYDGKILRKTGLADHADCAVYQYAIPDDIESVHIKSNFYGNTFIIFTDMATDGDFSASPYQQYPSSGYPTPTTVDNDYDTKGFKYVWLPLYKKSGITASAKYSAFELIDNNKQDVDDLNVKVTENKRDIVALQADVDELKGLMKYPGSFNMEIGNISLYGYNDLRYTSSTSRVRTLQGGNIHMKQGYKVTLSDYTTHRYFLYQIVSSERVNALGWKQEDFVVTDEADYAIIISALPEATVTDIAELASLMTIYPTKDEEDESGIPSYWDDEITASISTIQSNELSAGNRIFEFLFLTDTHWSHNAKNSPAIVEFLSDKFHINQIFGGDVITSHYEDKSQAVAEVRAFYDAFNKPLPTVLGNHDFNASNDSSQRLTMPECYALMLRQQEEVLGMNTFASPYYWTLDNESQKVRMIGFRCDGINAVSSDITNKVNQLISELSADWNVILLTHGFWAVTAAGDPISIATPVQAVIDAIKPTIESASASVPLWVVGHSHRDQSQVIAGTDKSILVLGCNCDAYAESAVWGGETMNPGTATEQAITCIQLDMANKKVCAVRIGAGSDRTFSY